MSAPPPDASLAQPLRAAYASLVCALGLPAAAAAEAPSAARGGLPGWCMRAIQTVTHAAPANRRVVAGASASPAADAELVLAFLSTMMHLLHMRPQMLDEDEDEPTQQHTQHNDAEGAGMDDAASQTSNTSVVGGRSLLPFLYAHLFRYALQLQQFETYYQLLLHMPVQFAHESATQGDNLKLECLKRFLIELLRDRRTHHLIHQFNWNFPWQPRAQSTLQQEASNEINEAAASTIGEKSVREEVEAILWFNAQTSDLSDDTEGAAAFLPSQLHNSAAFAQPSLAAVGSTATGGGAIAIHASHYDLLYSFLLSGHSYLRAAQCMHHFFLRLEAETHAGGGKTGERFAKNTVARLKKARGRALSAGQAKRGAIAAPSHSEQTQTELSMLTLDALGRLLRRKLHALVLVRDALQLAARSSPQQRDADPRECFMLENDTSSSLGAEQEQLEAAQKEASDLSTHSRSRLYKRSRNGLTEAATEVSDVASPFPITSRLDLLSLRAVENRLELVLSQLDMLSVLQSRVSLSHASLPPLDPLLDTPVQPDQIASHLEKLVRWGLFDRAFHMVQVFYNVTAIGGSATDAALTANPLNEPFEIASAFLFRELTARICRMHASLLDGEWTEEDLAFPLRVEDSMAELAMQGRVARGTATESTVAASELLESLRLRDAESVLQLYLHRFDALSTGLVFSLFVAEEYLTSGADVPLWLRDRFAACMDDQRDAEQHEDDEHKNASSGLFRTQRVAAHPSGHAATLSSFPFLTFLRLLLKHGRFELLFVLTCRYLDWLSASSISVVGGSSARSLDRSAVSDILDAFLWVADQAMDLPAGADSKSVQKQTQAWVDTLRSKLTRIIGGSTGAASGPRAGSKAPEQRVTVGFGPQQTTTKFGFGGPAPAVVPAFGAEQPAASPILPVGSVRAPSFIPAAPAASPFSGAGFGFGAPAAVAPAPAPAASPSFSPFASDQSAAAAPAKHAFGGIAPMQPAPAPVPSTAFSFGGTGLPSSAGLFGTPAPSSAAAATAPAPFAFGGFNNAAANPPNPFTSTAAIIARAAGAQ